MHKSSLFVTCILIMLSGQIYAQLFINEVMPANDVTLADAMGEFDDWIEIYNAGTSMDLGGLYISDNPADPQKWQIPTSNSALTTVAAGSYLILWADTDLLQGEDHLDFKLSSAGETLTLTAADGLTILDTFTFPTIATDHSYGRETDGASSFQIFSSSSPSADNSTGYAQVDQPVLSLSSGYYNSNQTLTISSPTPGVSIYYSTDGSDPDASFYLYTSPITIDSTQAIRAIAIKSGYSDSDVSTASYVFNNNSTFPVVFVSTTPKNLWDDYEGIHVTGLNGTTGPCESVPHNYNQSWKKAAHITLLEKDGSLGFSEDCAIEIAGGCSRRKLKKSLNVAFKDDYGPDELNYALFENPKEDKWKSFKLRSGGNYAVVGNRNHDNIMQDLTAGKIDIDGLSSRPVTVYLNGEYWGIFNIRERMNEDYIYAKYPKVDHKNTDVLWLPKSDTSIWSWIYEKILNGDNNDYYALHSFWENNSMAVQSNYDYAANQIDVNEFLNQYIAQVFYTKADWPGNNLRCWKEKTAAGKWRWMMFDLDSGGLPAFVSRDYLFDTGTDTAGTYQRNPTATLPFRSMLANTGFANEYIQRSNTYINTLWDSTRASSVIDSVHAVWQPEQANEVNRWGGSIADWDARINNIKSYIGQKPDYYRAAIDNKWSITGRINLTLNTNALTNGRVTAHWNHFNIPYNYTGLYHSNVPIHLKAEPDPGFEFVEWLETGVTDASIDVSYTSSATLTPVFTTGQDIVINEIHYNPMLNEAEEFVEIYNPSNSARDISGYKFEKGLCFEFPLGSIIAPDEYILVARDSTIYAGNGYKVYQWDNAKLSNSGETITLYSSREVAIDSVSYDDALPWNDQTDGTDFSHALIDHNLDNAQASSWDIQLVDKITPGAINFFCPNVTVGQTVSQPLCSGINDGQASINLSAGNAGYTFSWSHGPVSPSVNNLAPGSYIVTAMDTYGCMLTDTIDISAPTVLLQASLTKTEESVLAAGDGSINLSTSVVNAVSYLWSNGVTTEDISGLTAGTYTVDITDVNGCTTTRTITLNPGPQLPVAAATFTPNNGVAPINVSFNAGGSSDPDGTIVGYVWNFGDGSTGTGLNPTHNYSSPGLYTVTLTVTDSQGLTDTMTFSVNVIDTCDPPTGLTLISASSNALIVNWTGDPDAISYTLRYRDASVGGSWTNYNTTGTTAILTGLNACTDYEVKVNNVCNYNLQSGYTPTQIMSTTNCFQCTAPLGLYQFNIQNISAIITWDVLVGATSYTYKFRKVGDPIWISETTTFPIAVLFGISGCTDYEWTMETTCYDGSTAQSGTINNFSTVCKDENLESFETSVEEVNIYPIPANDIIYIQLPEFDIKKQMHILNESGKIIDLIEAYNQNFSIDISQYSKGMYYLMDGNRAYRFIVL